MATLMEKDVLLEYAHIGHLLPEKKTPEARQDSIKMGKLRKHIMMSEPQTLDFKEMVQQEISEKSQDVAELENTDIDSIIINER